MVNDQNLKSTIILPFSYFFVSVQHRRTSMDTICAPCVQPQSAASNGVKKFTCQTVILNVVWQSTACKSFVKMASFAGLHSTMEVLSALDGLLEHIKNNTGSPEQTTADALKPIFTSLLDSGRQKVLEDKDSVGNVIIRFGKYTGLKLSEIFKDENGRNWFSWILNGGFKELKSETGDQIRAFRDEIMDRLGIDLGIPPTKKRKAPGPKGMRVAAIHQCNEYCQPDVNLHSLTGPPIVSALDVPVPPEKEIVIG